MKYTLLFFLFVTCSVFAFDFESGVYSPKINDGSYHCSWKVDYDSVARAVSLKAVDDVWNNFKCNEDIAFTLKCEESESELHCQDSQTQFLARVPYTIMVQDPYNVTRDLGILIWRAEVPPSPTSFYGTARRGWTFRPHVRARCLLEPAGSEYCEAIPSYMVEKNCKGLEDQAKQAALLNCHKSGFNECGIVSSKVELLYSSRTETQDVFTGCSAQAVATSH